MRKVYKNNTKSRGFDFISSLATSFIILFLLAFPLSKQAQSGSVNTISSESEGNDVSIEISLSKAAKFTTESKSDPFRIELLIGTTLSQLPAKMSKLPFKPSIQPTTISNSSILRFDTADPMLIKSARYIDGTAKIRIELVKTDPETFATFLSMKAQQLATLPEQNQPQKSEAVPLPPRLELPSDTKKVVVIDAGHGGIDPGAIGKSGTKEKSVVLAFAQALKQELEATSKIVVKLSRPDDKFVSLPARVQFARDAKADLMISIHADTVRGNSARGLTFYTLSDQASDDEAAALASKENKVDVIAGLSLPDQPREIADILVDLVRRESKNHANYFAGKAVETVRTATALTGKPVRSADFSVLTAPDVPSVLIELGFLSNKEEEARLNTPAWRKKVAASLAKAVETYLAEEVAVNSISRAN